MKIADQVILAVISGSISALVANLFGYLSRLFYLPTIVMPELALRLWTEPASIPVTWSIILGNISSCVIGFLHAAAFIALLDLTGWRFFLIKSFVTTFTGWLLTSFFIFRLIGLDPHAIDDPAANLWFLSAHVVYLTMSSYIVSRYGTIPE